MCSHIVFDWSIVVAVEAAAQAPAGAEGMADSRLSVLAWASHHSSLPEVHNVSGAVWSRDVPAHGLSAHTDRLQ